RRAAAYASPCCAASSQSARPSRTASRASAHGSASPPRADAPAGRAPTSRDAASGASRRILTPPTLTEERELLLPVEPLLLGQSHPVPEHRRVDPAEVERRREVAVDQRVEPRRLAEQPAAH